MKKVYVGIIMILTTLLYSIPTLAVDFELPNATNSLAKFFGSAIMLVFVTILILAWPTFLILSAVFAFGKRKSRGWKICFWIMLSLTIISFLSQLLF